MNRFKIYLLLLTFCTGFISECWSKNYTLASGTKVTTYTRKHFGELLFSFKKVEELRPGDTIVSCKIASQISLDYRNITYSVIKEVEPSEARPMVQIVFGKDKLNCSSVDQPYYVKEKGWCSFMPDSTKAHYGVCVNKLEVGDVVYVTDTVLSGLIMGVQRITAMYERKTPVRSYMVKLYGPYYNLMANGMLAYCTQDIYDNDFNGYHIIDLQKGLDDIVFGNTSPDYVVKAFGKKYQEKKIVLNKKMAKCRELGYNDEGLTILTKDEGHGRYKVYYIKAYVPFKAKTMDGIELGKSDTNDLVLTYGKPSFIDGAKQSMQENASIKRGEDDPAKHYRFYIYGNMNAEFYIKDGVVVGISW